MPKNMPIEVLNDAFSLPRAKFKISTKKGESVEIKEAKPLLMYFSEYVVSPLAMTIISIDKIKARRN